MIGGAMPAERPPTKASENRRATKPIMEKRRRARINQCLSELKALILDALNKDPSRHSKLEKADILEMTVRHLQNIQRQQMAAAISTDPSVLNKFKAGFNECAGEVGRYIGRIEGVDPALRQRLLSHLSNCMTTMNTATTTFQPPTSASLGFSGAFPGMMSSLQSLSVQIPGNIASLVSNSNNSRSDINNNNTNGNSSPISNASSGGKLFGGLSLIPSRLPNGDFAFLLPSHVLSQQQSSQLFGLPSGSGSSSLPSQSSGLDRTSNSSWPPDSPRRSASPATSDNSALSPTGSDGGSDVFVDSYGSPGKHYHPHKDLVVLSPSSVPSSVIVRRPPPVVIVRHQDDRESDHHPLRSHQPMEGESVWRPW